MGALAALGIGLAVGALARRGKKGPQASQSANPQPPTDSIVPPPAPTSTTQVASGATAQAGKVASKQRRKAVVPTVTGGRQNPSATLQTASLLGL